MHHYYCYILGPVQHIPNIPINIKAIYKIVWEISQKKNLDLELPWHVYLPKPEFEHSHAESNCQSTGASQILQSSLRPTYVLHRHAVGGIMISYLTCLDMEYWGMEC